MLDTRIVESARANSNTNNMSFQSLFPLRSVSVLRAPCVQSARAVVAPRPVEFLVRWRETRRGGRFESQTPMLRPSSFMRLGGFALSQRADRGTKELR